MRLPDSLLAPLEIALNRYLGEDPDALARLAAFEGQVMAIHFREMGFSCYLRPHAGGFQVMGDYSDNPVATVNTTVPVLARSLLSDDKGRSLVLSGEIRLEGDTDVAESLLTILRDADFDPEEWLSRHIGDIPAYRVGQLFRGLFSRGQKTAESVSQDAVKFLRDDSRELVARTETQGWLEQVDVLRTDVDRIEARIKRLAEKLEPSE